MVCLAGADWARDGVPDALTLGVAEVEGCCGCCSSREECASDCVCEPEPLAGCTASCVPCMRMSRKDPPEDFGVLLVSVVVGLVVTGLGAIRTSR